MKGSFWRTSIVCCCAQSCHGFLEMLQKLKLSADNGFNQPLIVTVAEKQGRTRNVMKRRNLL
ncbi:hypothetical protein DPMN_004887 [Dreissena polymorpha]|uniref:Uncharacterized protein n=1 Tax=Dreissena polymorpha TaxID=45954 RepID=A0A9D4RW01_DREPO|nr:hypothetical protein DPMN_004887 [Dreissena polymorpha]